MRCGLLLRRRLGAAVAAFLFQSSSTLRAVPSATAQTPHAEVLDYSTMTIGAYPGYELRPESLESAYYLYRLTGDDRYRLMGGAMFEAIDRWTRTQAGFAALSDVRTRRQRDRMHSFLFAETLKYAYLLFAPPGTLDLGAVVLNTEAHPLRRTW